MVPAPGSPFTRMAGCRLGLPYLLSLLRLVCLLLFTFVLDLTFCPVEHAFEFSFIVSSLALVFASELNCLFTYFRLNYCVWTCFTLPYFRTLAFIWLSFCFLSSFRICVFSTSCVMLFKIVWIRISLNLYANVWRTSRIFVSCNCILIARKECLRGQPGFFLLHAQFFGLNY